MALHVIKNCSNIYKINVLSAQLKMARNFSRQTNLKCDDETGLVFAKLLTIIIWIGVPYHKHNHDFYDILL